jgi:hypothetical protein
LNDLGDTVGNEIISALETAQNIFNIGLNFMLVVPDENDKENLILKNMEWSGNRFEEVTEKTLIEVSTKFYLESFVENGWKKEDCIFEFLYIRAVIPLAKANVEEIDLKTKNNGVSADL